MTTSKSFNVSKYFSENSAIDNIVTGVQPVGIQTYNTVDDLPLSGVTSGSQAYVNENNRLYMWTGAGWFSIALINTSPSFDGGGAPEASYELDSAGGDPLVIQLSASDPEGLPIQWSYIASDSAQYFADITNDSSVFTITAKDTGIIQQYDSSGGTFSITFKASDGVNLATALSEFTIDFVTIIKDSKYTTLMLKTNETDGSQNNTFLDNSTNNFTITRNGNATQGSFSPYGDRWSNYFDGSDYLSVASNSEIPEGNESYTIEAWIYPDKTNNRGHIASWGAYSANRNNSLRINNSGNGILHYWYANDLDTGDIGLKAGQWYHIAATFDGTTRKIFIDGSLEASDTPTGHDVTVTNNLVIGKNSNENSEFFEGYISDVRINVGALYTSNFTPPVEPLIATPNASLLTCQSNRFEDNSTNNFTLTPTGDVKVTKFSPYDQEAYDATVYGGSGYFTSTTTDFLTVPANSAWSFNTGEFTAEAWVYFTDTTDPAYGSVIFDTSAGGNTGWVLRRNSSRFRFVRPGIAEYVFGPTPYPYQWYHVGIVKSDSMSTIHGFVNGTLYDTGSSYASTTNTALEIAHGGRSSTELDAYLSDVRIVKGSALYTTDFTPPAAPLTPVANTQLLCNFTNAGIYDASAKNVLETVGNAQVDTAVTKFGSGSMYFDGSGDVLVIPAPGIQLEGDFTIEAWVNRVGVNNADLDGIFTINAFDEWDEYPANVNIPGLSIGPGAFAYGVGASSTYSTKITADSLWHHIACVRQGSTIKVYIDGSSVTSVTNTDSYSNVNTPAAIGVFDKQGGSYRYYWNGYIEDLRITKGLARYTSNFTPPNGPLEG